MDYIREDRLVASLESVQTLRQLSVDYEAKTSNGLLMLARGVFVLKYEFTRLITLTGI